LWTDVAVLQRRWGLLQRHVKCNRLLHPLWSLYLNKFNAFDLSRTYKLSLEAGY
jgi:hypothetical protein